MMRKTFQVLSMTLLLLALLSAAAFATQAPTEETTDLSVSLLATVSGDYSYTLSGEKATITDYTGSATTLEIPATVDGYAVTTIGGSAFLGNTTLTSVTVPEGVVTISPKAFQGCTALQSITLPATLTKIDDYAFQDCSALASVTLPSTLTTIGYRAFYNCSSLESITIPAGVVTMEDQIFYNSITSITFSEGMTTIPAEACYNANKLTSVTLPSTLTKIDDYAFHGCSALASVSLPESLTYMGYRAFYNCTALESITIPANVATMEDQIFSNSINSIVFSEGMTTLPNEACYGANNLTSVSLPSTLTSFGSYAFYNCSSLTSLSIPISVTKIDDYAFHGCSALSSITLPDVLTFIGYRVFYNCSSLESITIPASVVTMEDQSFYNSVKSITFAEGMTAIPNEACYSATNLTSVTLPSTLTSIGNHAFRGCTALTAITLPDSVTSIGTYAFYGCTALQSIEIPAGVTIIDDYAFQDCSALSSVSLPNSLTEIGYRAFYKCSALESITIPAGVVTMEDQIFFNSVKSITFAEGMTVLPNEACYSATNLTSVSLPSTLTSIGNHAFRGCTALTAITLPDSVTSIGTYAFYGCTALQSIEIPAGVTIIDDYAFQDCSALSSVSLPNSLTEIGYRAFYKCSALESITIPASVVAMDDQIFFNSVKSITFAEGMTALPNEACYSATYLTSVTLPSTLTSIGNYAFRGCPELTTITIPETVTSIGSYAFYDCTALPTISLPAAVTIINPYTFHNCTSLQSITMSDAVTKIDDYAFEGCTLLENVTLPASLNYIGYRAFYDCSSLEQITIPASVTTTERYIFYNSVRSITFADGLTQIPQDICYYATNLEHAVFPASLTAIGEAAFYNCTNLTTLSASSVFTVGKDAFKGCSFTGTLSGGISYTLDTDTYILTLTGSGAMVHEGDLPWKGYACLISGLNIDPGITTICDGAFRDCIGLSGVVLPDSITTIGSNAFSGCSSLSYIELGSGLTQVGTNAFADCPSLDSVVFCGNGTSLGDSGLQQNSGVNIYYPQYSTGWDDSNLSGLENANIIQWDNSQPTHDVVLVLDTSGSMSGERISALKQAASDLVRVAGGRITNTRFAVVTYDDKADVLSNFTTDMTLLARRIGTIASGGNTYYLKAMDAAESLMSDSNADLQSMLFFSDGAPSDSTSSILSKANEMRSRYYLYTLGLSPSASGRSLLVSIAGSEDNYFEAADIDELLAIFGAMDEELAPEVTSTQVTLVHNLQTYDLLTQTISFAKGSSRSASITVTPVWGDNEPGVIQLTQNGKIILESETGDFSNIAPGTLFSASGSIYAELINDAGETVESRLLLLKIGDSIPVRSDDPDEVMDASMLELDTLLENISFGPNKLKGPSITIFNKTFNLFEFSGKVKLDLGDSKWNIQAMVDEKDKTIQVLVGYSPIDEDAGMGADYGKRGDWTDSYGEVRNLYKAMTGTTWDWKDKDVRKEFSNLTNKLKDQDKTLFLNIEGSIAGFMEWTYETGTIDFSEGGIILTAKAGRSIDSRIAAFPAAYVTVGLEGTLEGKIKVAASSETWYPGEPVSISSELKASPAANIGVGLGSKRTKTYIEGGLKGTLDFKILAVTGSFKTGNSSYDPLNVALSGDLYLDWKFLLFSGDDSWNIFELELYPKLELLDLDEDVFDLSGMTLMDRDYLNKKPISLLSADDFSYEKSSLYPYSEPQLCLLADGSMLLIWVDDTGEKSMVDRTSLMYSLYNPTLDRWSAPATIHDNAGYNGSPVIVQSGDDIHVIWQRIDASLAADVTLEEMYSKTELYYTVYHNGSFSTPLCLTDSASDLGVNVYSIAADGDSVAVVWVENETGDILQSVGQNTLYVRQLESGVWTEATSVYTTANTLDSTVITIHDGTYCIAYEEGTATDSTLKLYSNGSHRTIAQNEYASHQAELQNGVLYYLSDSDLYIYDLASGTTNATSLHDLSNFDLLCNDSQTAILTLLSDGFGCEMYASIMDENGAWGDLIQVTDYDKYIRSYSALLDANGSVISAFNLVDVDESNTAAPYGMATLAVKTGVSYADLIVGDAYYDQSLALPGGTISLTLPVANNNLEAVSTLTAVITDQAGVVVSSQTLTCEVPAGGIQDLTVNFTLPETLRKNTYTITLTPSYAETNTANNASTFEVGYADLVMTDTAITYEDGHMVFTGTLLNQGYDTAVNATVTLRDANFSGDILTTLEAGTLLPGESTYLRYILPDSYLMTPIDDSMHAINAEAISDTIEMNLSNNTQRHVFDGVQPFNILAEKVGDQVRVSVLVENDTDAELSGTMFVAIYAEDGRMLDARMATSVTKVDTLQQLSFLFAANRYPSNFTMKLFWVDSETLSPLMEPLAFGL